MARRKKSDSGGGGGGDWLNTYADMVTLLLTFFILLFAMSSIDSTKWNAIVKAFTSPNADDVIVILGDPGPAEIDANAEATGPDSLDVDAEIPDLSEIFEQIKQHIEDQGVGDSVQITQGDNYIFIRFMDNMLFEPNSARLKPADLEILNFVGMGIKAVQRDLAVVRIDGHTAAIPETPNYPVSDRVLSSERANAVLMYFEDVVGIKPELLVQTGFGKQIPLTPNSNDTPEGRSQNRRVEIFISTENVITEQLNNIYEKLVE